MTSSRRRLGLLFISLSVAIIIVDSTIVAVVMPEMVRSLGLDSSQVQWVQESYTLVFAAFLLPAGALADRWGRRRTLAAGLLLFALASLGIAAAPNGALLIAARLVQGVGGAVILPATLSLVNTGYTGRARGVAFAVWGATIGGMAALGPLLGGWLTSALSWHWAFGVNIPVCALILIGLHTTIAESRDPERRGVDPLGALLAAAFSGCLVFGLIEGRAYGWWEASGRPFRIGGAEWPLPVSIVPFVFALGAVLLLLFVLRSRRRDRAGLPTLLDFSLFRLASFRNGNLVAAIVALGEFGLILSLPLWMQNVLGYDALGAGIALLPLALGSFLASGLVVPLAARLTPVRIVQLGIVLEIAGLLVLATGIAADTPPWRIVLGLGLYGVGVGFATAQLTGVVLAEVPQAASGQASGTQSTSRQFGSALGIAVLGAVLFGTSGSALASGLREHGVPGEAAEALSRAVVDSAGTAIPGLAAGDPLAFELAREAFAGGTAAAAFTAAGFLGLALLASTALGRAAVSS